MITHKFLQGQGQEAEMTLQVPRVRAVKLNGKRSLNEGLPEAVNKKRQKSDASKAGGKQGPPRLEKVCKLRSSVRHSPDRKKGAGTMHTFSDRFSYLRTCTKAFSMYTLEKPLYGVMQLDFQILGLVIF